MTSNQKKEVQARTQVAGQYFIPDVSRDKLTIGLMATSYQDTDKRALIALWQGFGPPAPLQNADPWPDINSNNPDEQDG